jgi:hypothetical protein
MIHDAGQFPVKKPKIKTATNMKTTLEPIPFEEGRRRFAALKAELASLPKTSGEAKKRAFATSKGELSSLHKAKERLADLEKLAIQRGIKPPASGQPVKTLDQARRLVEDLERQLSSPLPEAEITAPAPENTETLPAKARAIVARSHAQSAARMCVHTAPAVRDMTITQLTVAIENAQKTKDFERVGLIYRQLRDRRAGQPTREISEAVTDLTDGELGLRIQNERDPEKQSMLYKQLAGRRAKG